MSKGEAWNAIINTNGLKELPSATTIFNKERVVRQVEFAISDSGATAHFLVEGAPIINMKEAKEPITIKLPDGSLIHSTHVGNLDIPWMPNHMTEAHIAPGLSHSSLISTTVFCDAGCKVIFDEFECKVYYNGQLMLSGGRDKKTNMWKLPINPVSRNNTLLSLDLPLQGPRRQTHGANNLYTLPFKQQQLKYMHQSFFNLPIQTLIAASNNNQLKGIPLLNNAKMIKKYLAPSPATFKGRLTKQRSNVRTTRPKSKKPNTTAEEILAEMPRMNGEPNVIPTGQGTISNVFCFAALADATEGTLYTDMTGSFPVQSLEGMQAFFVAYDYDTNVIFAIPTKDLKDATIVVAFEQVFNELEEGGFKPKFNVTDNQATKPIK